MIYSIPRTTLSRIPTAERVEGDFSPDIAYPVNANAVRPWVRHAKAVFFVRG